MIQEAKVIILGSISVGKSSIAMRFVSNQFNDFLESTLGAVFFEKSIEYSPGRNIKFQIWDTAGQEKYRAIARIYYKQAKAAIVVYDVNSRESFQAMKSWVSELRENGPLNVVIAIVGNKIDLMKEKEEVPYNQAKNYANDLGAIFKYTSAKQNKGIQELFVAVAERLQVAGLNDNLAPKLRRQGSGRDLESRKQTKGCC